MRVAATIQLVVLLACGAVEVRCRDAGPWVYPTVGEPWPLPQMMTTEDTVMTVDPSTFQFQVVSQTCDILEEALVRYFNITFNPPRMVRIHAASTQDKSMKSQSPRVELTSLSVDLQAACETLPYMNMDELYELKIDTSDLPGQGQLVSQSIWGILRGLETFSQLVYPAEDGSTFQVNSTFIQDFPRFSHRGILIDTSRHFLPISAILDTVDLMAQNKFNVFHWHIVDDNSFPFVSTTFPDLSTMGAYHPVTHVYTPQEVADVIEYGRKRGVRVVSEFDTPGHTQSWGLGQPGLLAACYSNGEPTGEFGPIDPSKESSFDFLREFFREVTTVYPDKYVHLGGDEVDFTCWENNPDIQAFMQSMNLSTPQELESYYIVRLTEIIEQLSSENSYVVWQEVFDDGVQVKDDTVIHVWKEESWEQEMSLVTAANLSAILSSCWYLNYISYGIDWHSYYTCDPNGFDGTDDQYRLVMGGEACMWGEYVDATNLTPRLWPRAAAVAERLWSDRAVNVPEQAESRLEEHRCRLLKRGYDVEPINGSGFCESDHLLK